MHCEHAVVIFLELSLFLGIANGAECYVVHFSEDVSSCPDFDNQYFKCDNLKLGMVEGKEAELGLNGEVELTKPIEQGMEMEIKISKVSDTAVDFMWALNADVCDSIKDRSNPVYPLMQSMKVDDCPVDAKIYGIQDIVLNMSHSEAMMNHEMCGEYLLNMCMMKNVVEKVSCHEMYVTLSQESC